MKLLGIGDKITVGTATGTVVGIENWEGSPMVKFKMDKPLDVVDHMYVFGDVIEKALDKTE